MCEAAPGGPQREGCATMNRMLAMGTVSALAVMIGGALHTDVSAVYGDPRFFSGPAPTRLIHNYYPGDEFIVTSPAGTSGSRAQMLYAAITSWNNALRSTPNSLTKYPLHFNQIGDANATIVVNFVSAAVVDSHCQSFGDGCNDLGFPVSNIWIDDSKASALFVMHELGHSFRYSDQYVRIGDRADCSPADTIMDAVGCTRGISSSDNNDFMYRYEPGYQSANPAYPDTWNASWNAYTQTGSVTEYFANSEVEWRYYWERDSDTGGPILGSGYTTVTDQQSLSYSYSTSRYCVLSKVYNETGYPGTRPWSTRSQYSCIGSADSQNAGYFLSSSDRNSGSGNALYLRVKNFSLFDRDVALVGPAFQDIGCGYARLAWLATRQCYISLGRSAYPYLQWYAKDPYNPSLYSYGLVDFE